MSIAEESKQAPDTTFNINRREFVTMALAGTALLSSAGRSSAKLFPMPLGIKLGTGAQNPTEENMLYP